MIACAFVRKALFIAITVVVASSIVHANEEVDETGDFDVVDELGLNPLENSDGNGFRFTAEPSLGGVARVIDFSAKSEYATFRVVWAEGHPYRGWRKVGELTIDYESSLFDEMMKEVSELMAQGEPDNRLPNGEILICTDGPGYKSEQMINGRYSRLDGFCGAHPNKKIASMLFSFVQIEAGLSTE